MKISLSQRQFQPFRVSFYINMNSRTLVPYMRLLLSEFSCYFHFLFVVTLKCLSIGTPKIINFPFVSNGKVMIFRCPNIPAHYNEAVLCLNFGTPENNEFSIWDKWKIYYF